MIGRTLSHYEFLEELGRGGMGVVYRARDVKLAREVAVKVLPPAFLADPEQSRRFDHEARAAAALEHPNIAVIHEIDEVDGVHFIVMELLRAKTLGDITPQQGLPPEVALDFAIQIASALSCAHANGILHRDIKPGNIMVSSDGHVKIIDFGLAKPIEAPISDSEDETLSRLQTEIGTIVGTAKYMSPEQARSETLDARTDVFSLGVVLFEMLTGKPPFQGTGAADILSSVLKDPTPRIRRLASSVPHKSTARLQNILDRCLAKDRDERYVSANSLAADLREARDLIGNESARPRWLGRWARATVVTGLLAASAIVGARWLGRSSTVAPRSADVIDAGEVQPAIAVVGFRNLSARDDEAWLSTALSEMLSTELATGDRLRIVSGEDVARMKAELGLTAQESFAQDTLARIRRNLGCDFVVIGSYLIVGESGSNALRLDARLQDTIAGETVKSVAASGSNDELFDIVRRTGAELREVLGVEQLSEMEFESVRAAASSVPEATRLYAEGLAKLRAFDATGARALVERAIELDPDFAQGHAALSDAWSQLGYDERAQESARRAFALSEGLPRKQRLLLRALSEERSSNWPGAVETLTILLARSPKNVDYGLRLAAAQGSNGSPHDGLETIALLRRLPAPLRQDPRIDLTEFDLAFLLDDSRRMVELSKDAANKARTNGASGLLAQALYKQGNAHRRLGELQASAQTLDSAIELFEQVGNARGVADSLNSQALVYVIQGNLSTAETLYRESLLVAREIGDQSLIATALYNLAINELKQGSLGVSAQLLEESLTVAREIPDPRREATRLTYLGRVAFEKAQLREAERLADDSRRRHETLGNQVRVSESLTLLSEIQLASGDLASARENLDRAIVLSEKIGHRTNAGRQATALGELLIHAGELEEASNQIDRGAALLRAAGESGAMAWNNVVRATILLEQGRASESELLARTSAEIFQRHGRRDVELRARTVQARAMREQGKTASAQTLLERIEAAAEGSESPTTRIAVTIESAHTRSVAGAVDSARRDLERALAEAETLGVVPLQYAARLVLADVSEDVDLADLAVEAEQRGFDLTARKAMAAATAKTEEPSSRR